MVNRRIARALVLMLCATACRQIAGIDDPQPWDDGGGGDGNDTNDGSMESCYGTGIVQLCLADRPTGAVTLPSGTFDTDNSTACATNVTSGASGACVVAGHTVTLPVGATLVAVGTKPLIVVAHDTITIGGTLGVASRRRAAPGAGSATGVCNAPSPPPDGGGGAGGSFGGLGGSGGASTPTMAGPTPPAPTSLRGGCAGQRGSGGGNAGAGGGATFLIAKTAIDVTGSINASGAGGEHADDTGVRGGSGGGSGGMIGLDAPMLQIAGAVFANGGGGSGGTDAGSEGDDGGDPNANSGGGGGGGSSGGTGGTGAAGASLAGTAGGPGVVGSSGGGGGGGGAGVVKLYGTRTGAGTISPPPT